MTSVHRSYPTRRLATNSVGPPTKTVLARAEDPATEAIGEHSRVDALLTSFLQSLLHLQDKG